MESEWKKQQRQAIDAFQDRNRAENEKLRSERNAKRYKAERDPKEYERQKARQRQEYADKCGGDVRSYKKITAATKDDHAQIRRARDAARKKSSYAAQSAEERQAESDKKADRQFVQRRKNKGVSDAVIQVELEARVQQREADRSEKIRLQREEALQQSEESEMRNLPTYGMFSPSSVSNS